MSRGGIYYWKCDRPAAFHGTREREDALAIEPLLREQLRAHFDAKQLALKKAAGQGNHLTWQAKLDDQAMFVRVENGPEGDAHLAVESALLDRVREFGVPTPRVFGCDATRSRAPFAWQALERIEAPDLNHWFKQGALDTPRVAFEIGAAVARWQGLAVPGFGPLQADLRGVHAAYADYHFLRLDEHLHFLVERGFIAQVQADEMRRAQEEHRALLDIAEGCLVHKDLALWNILGGADRIAAFIDFDDAIGGDPMDDLSLLACFHDAVFVGRALEGFQSQRVLPAEWRRRFWLHLLRNMIVKAVIRVGAGYFERGTDFFLVGASGGGEGLRRHTLKRLDTALRGLRAEADLTMLDS